MIPAVVAALAYGLAPVVYRPALECTGRMKALSFFSLFSMAAGLLLPMGQLSAAGLLYAASAALLGGLVGSWLYITSVKTGGPSVGNVSSSFYIVLLPVSAGRLHILPAAGLALLGIAVASWGGKGHRLGAVYGVAAAFVWTASLQLYARAVELMGPGLALVVRSAVVAAAGLLLGAGESHCRIGRLAAGGFLDSFVGFGSYTMAISKGDYVAATVVVSTYPLVTSLAERPFKARRALGAAIAFAGVYMALNTSQLSSV